MPSIREIFLVLLVAVLLSNVVLRYEPTPSKGVHDWKSRGRFHVFLDFEDKSSESSTELGTAHSVFYVDEVRSGWRAENPKQLAPSTNRTLVLLHGLPSSSYDWAVLWPALMDPGHFDRLIALDFLGFGFSDKPFDKEYSLDMQTDLTLSLLARLGVNRAHILSHDYGVSVAQELLLRSKAKSKQFTPASITYLNGGLFSETHRPLLIQKLLATPYVGASISYFVTFQLFQRNFGRIFGPQTQLGAQEMRDYWSLNQVNNGHKLMHRLIRYIEDRQNSRDAWVNAMQSTLDKDCPSLVINGPYDPVSGAHMVKRYRELFPGRPVVSLRPQIGHYPQLEDPGEVLVALFSFHGMKFPYNVVSR